MNSYFYVDTDDEITSVIGKLRGEKAEEIFLVVPKRALIAQSLVNLRLLDKEAKRHKKKLVFVSPDAHIRKLAEKAGLMVKKYVAKPKDETKEEALTLAPKSRKLEPWEEEAAKKELASIIKKEEKPKPGPIREEITAPGTKITVGAFAKPGNIIARPVPDGTRARKNAKGAAEVIDLKKPQLHRKEMAFPRKKLEPLPPKRQSAPILVPIKRRPTLSKKETLPREDVERRTVDNKMDIMKADLLEQKKPLKAVTNPFKVRKLERRYPPSVNRHDELRMTHDDISQEPIVDYPKEDIENPPIMQGAIRQSPIGTTNDESRMTNNEHMKKFDRETANLTLKEKEHLRDLWMEQKGMVRGKYVHENASLDLAHSEKTERINEELSSQSSGLFTTTHRRVGGPGKIVDLRVNSKIQTDSPKVNFAKDVRKEKKVILLPLINIRFLSLFILIILVVLTILAGIIIPDARITVKPKVNENNLTMNVWVNGEVSQADFNEHIIPGKPVHFKVTEEKTFPATGSREVKEKAQGQVTISNNTGNPLSLKQNALLTDSSGKKFYTQAPALIPAGKSDSSNSLPAGEAGNTNGATAAINPGSAVVTVAAEGTSNDYNLKTGTALTIPGLADSDFSSGITVEVKKEVTGGESRTVKTVTREDLDQAKAELLDKARQDSRGELEKNLDTDTTRIVKPETLTIEDIAYTTGIAEDDEADSFSANLTVTFFTLAFSQKELEELGKFIVEGESSEKSGVVKMNSFNVADARPLENKMEISADISYQLKSQVDAGDIRKELTAKKRSEAEEYLRGNKNIEQYTLDLWPGWPARLPLLERRIKVEVQ
ncbi:MAG: hypothetical protein V1690_00965 [Candidatus Moraniibacteriota bacterium]